MKTTLKIFGKTIFSLFEIVGAFLLVFIGLVIFALWKLSSGPVDVTFAADYVTDALVDRATGTEMVFAGIVAEWPEYSGPIILGLSGVEMREKGKSVLEIPRLGVKIAKAPLFIGMIKPQAIIITKPTLKLFRSKSGDFHLFVTSEPAPQDETEISSETTLKDIGNSFFKGENLPDYRALGPLSQIEMVSVREAEILVDDHQAGISWAIPSVNFDLTRGDQTFDLALSYKEREDQEDAEKSDILFSLEKRGKNEEEEVAVKGKLHQVNSAMLARVLLPFQTLRGQKFVIDGDVSGTLDKDWKAKALQLSVTSDKGSLNLDSAFDLPLTFSKLSAEMELDKSRNFFEIKDTTLNVNGATIFVSGRKNLDENKNDPYFPITLSISDLDFSTIHSLWPEDYKTTVLGEWMTAKLSDAKISGLKVTLPVNIGDLTDIPTDKIEASFSYENLKADYRPPMIPVEKAKGKASIKDDILNIDVMGGVIADLKISKGRVNITHLTHPTTVGDVTIDAELSGPLGSALDYIEREPIFLGEEKIGLKKNEVKGQADIKVNVVFPALKDLPAKDVKVTVDAGLGDVHLPRIVRGLDISGGPLSLKVEGPSFTIAGKAMLDGRDIDLNYSEYIDGGEPPYVSLIKAKLDTDQKLREHFGVNLSQFVKGTVPVEIDYREKRKGEIDIDVKADVTSSEVFIDALGFYKKAGITGAAIATAKIRNGEIQSVNDLKIAIDGGVNATGSVQFGKVGKIWDVTKVTFPSIKMASYADYALALTQAAEDEFIVKITGKKFDGRPYLSGNRNHGDDPREGEGDKAGQSVNATVNVDRIITGDEKDQFLISPIVSLSTNKNGDVTNLDLKGQTPNGTLSVLLKPDSNNRMALDITSPNAGEALHALDIYDRMIGGKLEIHGKQISGGKINDIEGQGQITDFTVVRAPALAKLINLFSITGLAELLQNKGIEFAKLKTDFEWKEAVSGDRVIILKNGRTSGASIGLSFEGVINQTRSDTDLKGTVVPMSEVNNLVSKIPLVGDILTGGTGGALIAATYTMKGNTDDPSVFLNPLSVLTPGFLRMILFEGDRDIAEPEQDSSKPPKNKKQYNQ